MPTRPIAALRKALIAERRIRFPRRAWSAAQTPATGIVTVMKTTMFHASRSRATNEPDARSRTPTSRRRRLPVAEATKGELQLVVSISNQHVTLYSNGNRVAQGPVSTGVPGHLTPMGVFSIIEKDRYHHSNLYSNAPMPYMSGSPGRAWRSTRGHCPAARLRMAASGSRTNSPRTYGRSPSSAYGSSSRGTTSSLLISHTRACSSRSRRLVNRRRSPRGRRTRRPSEPPSVQVAGPAPGPERVNACQCRIAQLRSLSKLRPRPQNTGTAAVSPGTGDESPKAKPPKADPETPAEELLPAQPPLPKPSPIGSGRAAKAHRPRRRLHQPQGKEALRAPGLHAAVRHSGRNRNPDLPLGTHVFTALELQDDGAKMRWNAITMPEHPPRPAPGKDKKSSRERAKHPWWSRCCRHRLPRKRLIVSRSRRRRLIGSTRSLVPGSSLVISDQGLGQETGKGTDFVVVTR